MFAPAQALTLAAISLQSGGTVLYSAFLAELHAAQYLFFSLLLTAAVCLVLSRGRMPPRGRGALLLVNGLTALSFGGFYFALRYLPPAVVGAMDMGIAVLVSMAMEAGRRRAMPARSRVVCATGIGVACLFMGWTAWEHLLAHPAVGSILSPLAGCVASGIGSGWGAQTSKRMHGLGWSPQAVLAHRFHLPLVLALLWGYCEAPSVAPGSVGAGLAIAAVGAAGVLAPQLLLQRALSSARPGSVLATMALQPAIAYGCSLLKTDYAWHAPTFVAVMLLSVSVALDIRLGASAQGSARKEGHGALEDDAGLAASP